MFDLRQALIEKRDENPPPNNNYMQPILANTMLAILDGYTSGNISLREYKRQMRLLKFQMFNGFINGKTQPLEYTGMGDLIQKALAYPES